MAANRTALSFIVFLVTIGFAVSSELSTRAEETPFSLIQNEQKIFNWKGCDGSDAVIQIHVQGGSNLQTFAAAGRIPSTTSEFLVQDGQVLSSQSNSDDVIWYFLVRAVGGSVPSGSLSVDSIATSVLNSGSGTLNLGAGSMQLFKLAAKPNSGAVIQVVAPAGVKSYASSVTVPGPTNDFATDENGYAATIADGSSWWILVRATSAVDGQITVNYIDTVTVQSGVAATATIPANGKRVYKFAPTSGAGLVKVSFTEGLKLIGVAGSGELCYLGNDAYHSSQGDDTQPWFFVLSGSSDGSTSASFTVESTAVQAISSGQAASFSVAEGEEKIFKLAAASNTGAAVKVEYTGDVYVYASQGVIAKSEIPTSGGYQLGKGDNADWYFVVVGTNATSGSLTVTTVSTTTLTSGAASAYNLEVDEIKVFKLAGSAGATGLVQVANSGTGNFRVYVSRNGLSRNTGLTAPVSATTWLSAESIASDNVDWWFIAQSIGQAVTGASLQVTSVATKSFESGASQTVTLAAGEYQIYKLNGQTDKGAAINVQFDNRNNYDAYISAGMIPKLVPLVSYNDEDTLLSNTSDNVPWYFVFKATQSASFTFQATLLATQVLQYGASANVNLAVGQYKVFRVEGFNPSTSFAQVLFSAGQGAVQPIVTLGGENVNACFEEGIESGEYIPARDLTPKSWYITVTSAEAALVESSITVSNYDIFALSGACDLPTAPPPATEELTSPSASSVLKFSEFLFLTISLVLAFI